MKFSLGGRPTLGGLFNKNKSCIEIIIFLLSLRCDECLIKTRVVLKSAYKKDECVDEQSLIKTRVVLKLQLATESGKVVVKFNKNKSCIEMIIFSIIYGLYKSV